MFVLGAAAQPHAEVSVRLDEATPREHAAVRRRTGLQRQPPGVVGVVSPWNYPQLALGPAITALAAGNRVMLAER
jgi:acyl-CoA reductase-like NAD-dependent aldehyde dehydrogenase